jgi:hypothetical protein
MVVVEASRSTCARGRSISSKFTMPSYLKATVSCGRLPSQSSLSLRPLLSLERGSALEDDAAAVVESEATPEWRETAEGDALAS